MPGLVLTGNLCQPGDAFSQTVQQLLLFGFIVVQGLLTAGFVLRPQQQVFPAAHGFLLQDSPLDLAVLDIGRQVLGILLQILELDGDVFCLFAGFPIGLLGRMHRPGGHDFLLLDACKGCLEFFGRFGQICNLLLLAREVLPQPLDRHAQFRPMDVRLLECFQCSSLLLFGSCLSLLSRRPFSRELLQVLLPAGDTLLQLLDFPIPVQEAGFLMLPAATGQ